MSRSPTNMQSQKLHDCASGIWCPQTSERKSLGGNIGEKNSTTLPKSVCAATFTPLQWTSLPTATPEQDWILRCAHCAATQNKWTLITSKNFRVWQITWTMPTVGINGGNYQNYIGPQEYLTTVAVCLCSFQPQAGIKTQLIRKDRHSKVTHVKVSWHLAQVSRYNRCEKSKKYCNVWKDSSVPCKIQLHWVTLRCVHNRWQWIP